MRKSYVTLVACLGALMNVAQRGLAGSLEQKQIPFGFDKLSQNDIDYFQSKPSDFWQAKGQDTTLRQVLLIHRHGDRTPIEFGPTDPLRNEPFWEFHGLGQLTNRGKTRLAMLGHIMRMRYDKFLDGSVSKNLRKSRASGALRCIESAQVFLATFLGLNQNNSPDAASLRWDHARGEDKLAQQWQPSSVATLAASLDGMLNEGAACASFNAELARLNQTETAKRLSEDYQQEARIIKQVLDFDITDWFYKWFWAGSFLEVERSYFGQKFDSRLESILDRVNEASNKALSLYASSVKSRRLRAGLLVNDMLDNMLSFRANVQQADKAGPFNKKFVHYSAHDLNLVQLLSIFDNIGKHSQRPDYASSIMLELHQDQLSHTTDEWHVKLFYLPHVPAPIEELHIERCETNHPRGRCTLDKLNELMDEYKIASWQAWMHECANDLTKVNPYTQNT